MISKTLRQTRARPNSPLVLVLLKIGCFAKNLAVVAVCSILPTITNMSSNLGQPSNSFPESVCGACLRSELEADGRMGMVEEGKKRMGRCRVRGKRVAEVERRKPRIDKRVERYGFGRAVERDVRSRSSVWVWFRRCCES